MAKCKYNDVIFDIKGLLKEKKCYNRESDQKNGDDTQRYYSCKIWLLIKVMEQWEVFFSCIQKMLQFAVCTCQAINGPL